MNLKSQVENTEQNLRQQHENFEFGKIRLLSVKGHEAIIEDAQFDHATLNILKRVSKSGYQQIFPSSAPAISTYLIVKLTLKSIS